MATVLRDFTAAFVTTKDAPAEKVSFTAGQKVQIMRTWERFVLIKDEAGHYYNVDKALVAAD